MLTAFLGIARNPSSHLNQVLSGLFFPLKYPYENPGQKQTPLQTLTKHALCCRGNVKEITLSTQTATDPLLNEVEAAQILGVKPTTLQIWRCTKRYFLPYVKVGRLVRYRTSALDAFVTSRTQGADK